MSAALTPQVELVVLAKKVVRRLGIIQHVAGQWNLLDQLGDRQLEVLYNARMLPDGQLSFGAVRVGQSEWWRDHWDALAFDIGAEDTLDAVQMGAKLLRCRALIVELAVCTCFGRGPAQDARDCCPTPVAPDPSGHGVARSRSAALVVRHTAQGPLLLRSERDEAGLATACCRHQPSIEGCKAVLRSMYAWRAGRIAVDANYVPSWETNIGMIWGLFAATPAIVRIHSPNYRESVWCRRELELTEYVLKQSDFLSQRWIIDLEQPELRRLDEIVQA